MSLPLWWCSLALRFVRRFKLLLVSRSGQVNREVFRSLSIKFVDPWLEASFSCLSVTVERFR